MQNVSTCRDGPSYYADVDVGMPEYKRIYTDNCYNYIVIDVQDDQSDKGYKKCIHKLPTKSHKIGGIYCDGRKQGGFKLGNCKECVRVYYLDYDKSNALPLIVGITRDDKTYEYYRKDYYLKDGNMWKTFKETNEDKAPYEELKKIRLCLNGLVVLRLDQNAPWTYYANGRSENPPEINKDITITVSHSTYAYLYKRYKHVPKGGIRLRPLSTTSRHEDIPFINSFPYTSQFASALAYYWIGDIYHENPLILELVSPGSIFTRYKLAVYEKNDSDEQYKRWKYDVEIRAENLENELSEQNCLLNDAHRAYTSARSEYTCSSCNRKRTIYVDEEEVEAVGIKYGKCKHYIKDGSSKLSISSFYSQTDYQMGLPPIKDVDSIYIYKYPGAAGVPILINVPLGIYGKWYRKTKNDNEWAEMALGSSDRPTDDLDEGEIFKAIINVYAPLLVIEADKSAGQEYYGTSNEKVRVESDEGWKESDYKKLLHVRDGGYFRLNNIKSGDHIFKISSADPLSLLSIFYVKSKGGGSVPVLIELEMENKTYKYYSKASGPKGWTEYTPPAGQVESGSNKVTREALKVKLYELKKMEGSTQPEALTSPTKRSHPGLIAVGVIVGVVVAYKGVLVLRDPQNNVKERFIRFSNRIRRWCLAKMSWRGT